MRTEAHHCLSAAARIRQLLPAAWALLPLYEALRLPALALVHKLRATSELEFPLICPDGPIFYEFEVWPRRQCCQYAFAL
jgi:hypothetical protein